MSNLPPDPFSTDPRLTDEYWSDMYHDLAHQTGLAGPDTGGTEITGLPPEDWATGPPRFDKIWGETVRQHSNGDSRMEAVGLYGENIPIDHEALPAAVTHHAVESEKKRPNLGAVAGVGRDSVAVGSRKAADFMNRVRMSGELNSVTDQRGQVHVPSLLSIYDQIHGPGRRRGR